MDVRDINASPFMTSSFILTARHTDPQSPRYARRGTNFRQCNAEGRGVIAGTRPRRILRPQLLVTNKINDIPVSEPIPSTLVKSEPSYLVINVRHVSCHL